MQAASIVVLLLGSIFLVGCNFGDGETKEYKAFVKEHNSSKRQFCDEGFLMEEEFLSPQARAPIVRLVNSQKCK